MCDNINYRNQNLKRAELNAYMILVFLETTYIVYKFTRIIQAFKIQLDHLRFLFL